MKNNENNPVKIVGITKPNTAPIICIFKGIARTIDNNNIIVLWIMVNDAKYFICLNPFNVPSVLFCNAINGKHTEVILKR